MTSNIYITIEKINAHFCNQEYMKMECLLHDKFCYYSEPFHFQKNDFFQTFGKHNIVINIDSLKMCEYLDEFSLRKVAKYLLEIFHVLNFQNEAAYIFSTKIKNEVTFYNPTDFKPIFMMLSIPTIIGETSCKTIIGGVPVISNNSYRTKGNKILNKIEHENYVNNHSYYV